MNTDAIWEYSLTISPTIQPECDGLAHSSGMRDIIGPLGIQVCIFSAARGGSCTWTTQETFSLSCERPSPHGIEVVSTSCYSSPRTAQKCALSSILLPGHSS